MIQIQHPFSERRQAVVSCTVSQDLPVLSFLAIPLYACQGHCNPYNSERQARESSAAELIHPEITEIISSRTKHPHIGTTVHHLPIVMDASHRATGESRGHVISDPISQRLARLDRQPLALLRRSDHVLVRDSPLVVKTEFLEVRHDVVPCLESLETALLESSGRFVVTGDLEFLELRAGFQDRDECGVFDACGSVENEDAEIRAGLSEGYNGLVVEVRAVPGVGVAAREGLEGLAQCGPEDELLEVLTEVRRFS